MKTPAADLELPWKYRFHGPFDLVIDSTSVVLVASIPMIGIPSHVWEVELIRMEWFFDSLEKCNPLQAYSNKISYFKIGAVFPLKNSCSLGVLGHFANGYGNRVPPRLSLFEFDHTGSSPIFNGEVKPPFAWLEGKEEVERFFNEFRCLKEFLLPVKAEAKTSTSTRHIVSMKTKKKL